MIGILESLGRITIGIFHQLGAVLLLLAATIRQCHRIQLHETAKQCLDLGVKSFPIVGLTLLLPEWCFPFKLQGN